MLDMEDNCLRLDFRKRNVESDATLIFMLGPGGRATVMATQSSDEPETPTSQQVSETQGTPSTVDLPLSHALSTDASATVTGDSSARMNTIVQLLPTTSSLYASGTSFDPTDSATENSIALETSAIPASISADTAFETVVTSSLQTSLPTTVSSEAVNLKPPVYAGIALGTIAGIACLTALIAWWIRTRSHAKRRRLYDNTDVSWVPSENGDTGLEEARDMTQARFNLESIGLGGKEDLAQVQLWEPSGDRDVGEPRRSENCPGGLVQPLAGSHPCQAAPAVLAQRNDFLPFIQPFQNGPYPNARSLPSYLRSVESISCGSVDDHSAVSSLGPLRVANLLPGDQSAATSRAATALGMNNRTYSLATEELESILGAEAELSEITLDRYGHSAYSSQDLGLLRGEDMQSERREQPVASLESEGWTASLKSIFGVMASNLSKRNNNIKKREDALTPAPRKRSRKSMLCLDENYMDDHTTVFSESITACSLAGPDGDNKSRQAQPPLKRKRGTRSGQLRRDLLSRSTGHGERRQSQDSVPSRASSIYSTSSAAFSQVGDLPATPSRNSSFSGAKISRPPSITRVSSTGCSVAPSQLTDKEEAAQMALVDRRRRTRRHDDWSEREVSGE